MIGNANAAVEEIAPPEKKKLSRLERSEAKIKALERKVESAKAVEVARNQYARLKIAMKNFIAGDCERNFDLTVIDFEKSCLKARLLTTGSPTEVEGA